MYELRSLGARRLRRVGDPATLHEPTLLSRPKHFALVAYLTTQNGNLCRRDTLLALFWPELDEPHARNALSKMLSRIRAELGDRVIRTVGAQEVGLHPGSIRSDVCAFLSAIERDEWEDALELYHGDFLDGFHLAASAAFQLWLDTVRRDLRAKALTAASRLAGQQERVGDSRAAIGSLRRAVAVAPIHEPLVRRLMLLLEREGERAAALTAYHVLEDALHAEIGIAPEPETRDLATRIRTFATIRSLGVLPWVNLTGTPDHEHLADGLTDVIITELARLRVGRVVSRQSSLRLKGSTVSLTEAGKVLGIDAAVEGSVVRAGNRITVTAQLVRVEPEEHLWAERFECELGSLSEIARSIAEAVADRVHGAHTVPRVVDGRRGRAAIDAAAYEAYLKGRHFSAMLPDLGKAVGWYRVAIERAPEFAPAWAGLASAYAILTLLAHVSPEEIFPPFRDAAERAVQLDPSLGEAHTSLALYRMLAKRAWNAAEDGFRRGVESGANVADTWMYRAVYLAAMGRASEARADTARALEIDPLGASTRFTRAWCEYKAGNHAESNRHLMELMDLHPTFSIAFVYLAANHALLGEMDRAAEAASRGIAAMPESHEALALGIAALARAGKAAEADGALQRLLGLGEARYLDPWAVGVAYAGLGRIDDAVDWFQRMYAERSPSAFCIRCDPLLEPLRADRRFRDIVRRLAFPPIADSR